MSRSEFFYVRPNDVYSNYLRLRKDEFHHLVHVYRRKRGDIFSAVDGKGHVYECQIEEVLTEELEARIVKKARYVGEPYFQLTTALAVPKKDRFELLVEKGTEVGISKFIPLLTERTVVKVKSIRLNRCQKIALAAMKQSRRSVLPAIEQPSSFEKLCQHAEGYNLKLLAHEKTEHRNLDDLLQTSKTKNRLKYAKTGILCIGPEGGFTDEEARLATKHGFATFGLGPRRLRAETAALIASVLVLDRMGELR
ncbi:16S rRNA (uracil(1498)-N(3))-methyltransferase [candidate division KSB1 bacterium]|nr:16S rRNA (uracil(1498)-N(3))-methyltransferase [candidate division KSB1 bacterium]NIR69922.1 16S rRNA (uracil(1498)-N(3))-methyltransferase [candidate division KSB1 bacterium]NIS25831.1 16S rRNA (uracil(1498)-N(3))-methyltransferase [candidate division KSB1 bacterium]NIT72706.1 16S rRNA (uracil(1498)-N(3))-methyltransferase [candidate division KSB1 bacterium]NIU26520.1 16S rRNA (uracil(1498)-N(3))-methyltransferase [candidate division KSB1 bacterium]